MSTNPFAPTYIDQSIAEYRNNPLLEALPPILSEKQVATKMLLRPSFDAAERELPSEERWHLLARLKHLVVPRRPIFYEVERTISRLIRAGYIVRNPLDPGTWRMVYNAQDLSRCERIDPQLVLTESQALLVGLSGSGKTTCANAILRTYPQQVIQHTAWHEHKIPITQIVWIKVTCPKNGSISSFCREFARQVDLALHTGGKYEKEFSKSKMREDMLEGAMRQIAATHFLGILFIDEIQRLNLSKTGGSAPLLHFLQDLRTSLRVPVVEIGTYKAAKLFSREMKDARRASENGLLDFRRPLKRNKEWDDFVRRIWTYQWVQNPVNPDDDMLTLIFDLTQSIPDVVVLLFKLAQQRAMWDGSETINTKLLEQTYDESLTLMHAALNELRKNTVESLSRYEDLLPPEEMLADLTGASEEEDSVQDHLEQLYPLPGSAQDAHNQRKKAEAATAQVKNVIEEEANNSASSIPPADKNYKDLRDFANDPDSCEALKQHGIINDDPFGLRSKPAP
ncbi:MAG TPA: ATP-binding protein [Burkholderiaceae bacterium]|jgi:ABC-type dipeptide/oligopeptide/nickel transport system ATPase component